MALWQFDIKLLPAESVMRRYQAVPLVISKADFDEERWWKGTPTSQNLEAEFSKMLPPAQSWTDKLKVWGHDEGDRIDLWSHDGTTISGLYVRIDVRDISKVFLANVLTLARRHSWLLRTEDGKLFQPSFAQLLSAIHASDSFRFVEDPKGFLEALGKAQENEPKDGNFR